MLPGSMEGAMNVKAVSAFAILAALLAGASLQAAEPEPLPVAKQGYLFAGGKYSTINGKEVMSGQIYAEYQIPRNQTHPYPIVMVHGAIQTGTNFTGTPDGREGWAHISCAKAMRFMSWTSRAARDHRISPI
jgi:hypothetical protein